MYVALWNASDADLKAPWWMKRSYRPITTSSNDHSRFRWLPPSTLSPYHVNAAFFKNIAMHTTRSPSKSGPQYLLILNHLRIFPSQPLNTSTLFLPPYARGSG